MTRIYLSNDRTEVDMNGLARAFGLSREALDETVSLGVINYFYELGPGDTATPRMVFRSKHTGQRVTLDRIGRIMPPENGLSVDRPVPCSATCRPDGAPSHTANAVMTAEPADATGQSRQHVAARRLDDLLDEALRESFPASDPVAISFDAPRPGP